MRVRRQSLPRARAALAACGAMLALTALLLPTPARAHGLVQRADLPVPDWLFGWGAAIVLVVSFAGLAVLWQTPRLEGSSSWRPAPLGKVLGSGVVESICGAVGTVLLGVTVWAGLAGDQGSQTNFAPTFMLVIFWVGLAFASLPFGDVFRAFNPWRAVGRLVGWGLATARGGRALPHRPYPAALGHWPAAAGLLGFTWIELASNRADEPSWLATCAIVYSVVTWIAMAAYGVEAWASKGEAFGVYFGLFARLSVFERRNGTVGLRQPLAGLATWRPPPGTVAVVAVMIGTVTFDGLSQGSVWQETLAPAFNDLFAPVDTSALPATTLANSLGLLLCVGLVALFYGFGISGMKSVTGERDDDALRLSFVHTLVPIALVYVMAHYLTFLVFQGQAISYLASDPLGRGWDLFGTASAGIDYSVLSQTAAWYLQVAFVVLGHVGGLILAHDRAIARYEDVRTAARSQYWMLGVMVGFTSLALWLLSQANA